MTLSQCLTVALVVEGIVASVPNMARYTPSGLDDLANRVALKQGATDWYWSVVFNGVVIAVTIAVSWLAFRRQEPGGNLNNIAEHSRPNIRNYAAQNGHASIEPQAFLDG